MALRRLLPTLRPPLSSAVCYELQITFDPSGTPPVFDDGGPAAPPSRLPPRLFRYISVLRVIRTLRVPVATEDLELSEDREFAR